MPDTGLASALIDTARRLTQYSKGHEPSQADLRRAISTSYYAVFHALAKFAADGLVGAGGPKRPNKAWVEVYRGLIHGKCRDACLGAKNIAFPDDIKDFADGFLQLQSARLDADYNPMIRATKENAQMRVSSAERNIQALDNVSERDCKAFSTWVLITSPGAVQARKWAKTNNNYTHPTPKPESLGVK